MFPCNWMFACLAIGLLALFGQASGAELLVGTASTDITPDEPVPLCGQFHLRVSQGTETPITANVLALESRESGRSVDLAIVVSCDVVYIPADVPVGQSELTLAAFAAEPGDLK